MINSTQNQTDELHDQLRQLVAETCCHAKGSLARQKSLNRLVWRIQQSGKLLRGTGVLHYEDALQQTWLYFCRNLCEATTTDPYDPERASVLTWINAHLKRRLQDIYQEAAKQKAVRAGGQMFDDVLDPLKKLPARPEPPPILEDIREWIDKEGSRLQQIHLRDRPDVNCQVLLLHRLPSETSWEELARAFGVAIPTLSSFYQRKCFPLLLEFGKSQGYIDP